MDKATETRSYQAEVKQILDLMIHSLYSRREIFLRELISNASDALDKLRFEALANEQLYEGDGEPVIRVSVDRKARTITVADNGIGMSREEAIEHLGTIARSGTKEFLASLTGEESRDAELIGQFGVGFYSSFIVADRVEVRTRRAGLPPEQGVRWVSSGDGTFTVENMPLARRGTEVVLHLREGEDEFLEGARLREIIRKYSDHISYPIRMPSSLLPEHERGDSGEGGSEEVTVNRATALWTRPRTEISPEEYAEFYRHVAHDFEEPLEVIHARVEGNVEYTALLFIPRRAPFDLWDRHARRGIRLYVRRVFIMEDAGELLPPWLRFVRGVIDAADLPLNVSREVLQANRQVEVIRAGCVKRVLDQLERMAANDPEKYRTFWEAFGKVLKEGIIEDPANRERIARLLRFASTHGDGDTPGVSLQDYVARMKPGQQHIYYVSAESPGAARNSPHLEAFRKHGVEVLLLTDEIDEWMVAHLGEFEGRRLRSVAKGEVGEELAAIEGALPDTAASEAAQEEGAGAGEAGLETLLERIAGVLGERVKQVRPSRRLTESAACIVFDEHELGPRMQRLLRQAGQSLPPMRPVLEVNPAHPLLARMHALEEPEFREWAQLLLDQAVLAEGGTLEDPAAFVHRMNRIMSSLSAPAAGGSRRARAGARAATGGSGRTRTKREAGAGTGAGAEGGGKRGAGAGQASSSRPGRARASGQTRRSRAKTGNGTSS